MSIKEQIAQLKELQKSEARKLVGKEVLGFKVREWNYSSEGRKYKSMYAIRCVDGRQTQIFLGYPENLQEIEDKIHRHFASKNLKI